MPRDYRRAREERDGGVTQDTPKRVVADKAPKDRPQTEHEQLARMLWDDFPSEG